MPSISFGSGSITSGSHGSSRYLKSAGSKWGTASVVHNDLLSRDNCPGVESGSPAPVRRSPPPLGSRRSTASGTGKGRGRGREPLPQHPPPSPPGPTHIHLEENTDSPTAVPTLQTAAAGAGPLKMKRFALGPHSSRSSSTRPRNASGIPRPPSAAAGPGHSRSPHKPTTPPCPVPPMFAHAVSAGHQDLHLTFGRRFGQQESLLSQRDSFPSPLREGLGEGDDGGVNNCSPSPRPSPFEGDGERGLYEKV